jgi:transposase-like protein
MHQESKKKDVVRRSPEEIQQLLEVFEKNGESSVKDFCQLHGIREATYYNWRKRYRSNASQPASEGFIAIVPSEKIAQPIVPFAEVKGIRIYQPVPAEYLKTLAS